MGDGIHGPACLEGGSSTWARPLQEPRGASALGRRARNRVLHRPPSQVSEAGQSSLARKKSSVQIRSPPPTWFWRLDRSAGGEEVEHPPGEQGGGFGVVGRETGIGEIVLIAGVQED